MPFVITAFLDTLVLVPRMGLTAAAYVEQIGLIYLIIPSLTMVLLRRPTVRGAMEGAPARHTA